MLSEMDAQQARGKAGKGSTTQVHICVCIALVVLYSVLTGL